MSQSPEYPLAGEDRAPDSSAARSVFLLAVLAVVLVVAASGVLGRLGACPWAALCGPLLADDITQGRLDTALPAPQADGFIEQTFTPRRDGLTEIELLLARYGEALTGGFLALELRDDRGAIIAQESLPADSLTHNQIYTLRFEPQRDSAGRPYTLRLFGRGSNPVSVWAYSLDVNPTGALRVVAGPGLGAEFRSDAQELRFTARYALTAGDALRAAARPLAAWRLLLAALLYVPLPGVWLLLFIRPRGWDGAAWWGAALALGVAVWPVLWLWLSLAGGRWSGPLLWAVVAVGWIGVAALDYRRRSVRHWSFVTRHSALDTRHLPPATCHLLLLALILITLASRFVAVRDQAFPPWVDSSRHALISAAMTTTGRAPDGYAPYLPIDIFPYHYGFHALSAGLQLMTAWPQPELLLVTMQLLGGLLPLTVYTAGWMVTRRPAVGLLAAFLVALPFFFPGYYATWGRMTQLTAMLVMPLLLGLTWRVGRGWPRFWPLVGVLAAGLFLIHFRVFLFYLPFAALAVVSHLVGHRRLSRIALAGALAALLVLPQAITLWNVTDVASAFGQSLPGYNDFPIGYLTTGWELAYLALAGAALMIVLVGVVRRRLWAAFPLLLALWVGVLFVLLSGDRLGLPELLVINLNSMYITLFLPLALLLAIVAGRVWSAVQRWTRRLAADGRPRIGAAVRFFAVILAALAIGLLLTFGWRQQANILNPQTILSLPEDIAALEWMDANLPVDARVAVNAWQWLGATWAGSDGGAWLTPLTAREATTPPIDYIYDRDLFARVRAFNEAASAVTDWSDPAAASWLAEQGVTHVYVGERGGYFEPAELSRNPRLTRLYDQGGTFVFVVD